MTDPAKIYDKRRVIAESYRIDGISAADCRSIFLDWALGLPEDVPAADAAAALLDHYGPPADHPMTGLLKEAAESPPFMSGRRGGPMGRERDTDII